MSIDVISGQVEPVERYNYTQMQDFAVSPYKGMLALNRALDFMFDYSQQKDLSLDLEANNRTPVVVGEINKYGSLVITGVSESDPNYVGEIFRLSVTSSKSNQKQVQELFKAVNKELVK